MLTWPHPGTDWADRLPEVETVFEAIARAVLRFEHLVISCEHVSRLQQLHRDLNRYAEERGLPGLRGYLRDLHGGDEPAWRHRFKLLLVGPTMAVRARRPAAFPAVPYCWRSARTARS